MTATTKGSLPNRYSGELRADEIATGMNAAMSNAQRLASDAKFLLEHNRYPTAASVAVLSIEESGKLTILRRLAVARNEKELKDVWRDFRSHRTKNTKWILPILVAAGARTLIELKDAADPTGEHTAILDALKQIGFYTDCYGDRHWSIPSEVIEKDVAEQLVATAEMLSKGTETSTREIQLWQEIMGPVWETAAMQDALLRWHEALVDEGLSSHEVEEFKRFVLGPKGSN